VTEARVVQLRPANDDEKRARDLLTHAAWGQRLTPAQFAEREVQLRAHPWARENMTTWFLCGAAGEVLASCETFRMESFAAAARGSTYGVASVFTEPALRGRGYASRMMERLVRALPARDPAAQASILFSDVGAPLYERAGYVARPAFDVLQATEAGDPGAGVDALVTDATLAAEHARLSRPEDAGFVVWPTAAQLDWHLERERAYAEVFARARPPACGARAGDAAAFWAADFKNEKLVVLLAHAPSADALEALARAARRAAGAAGLREVALWDSPAPLGVRLLDGRRVEREGSLPMICPLAPVVDPGSWSFIPRGLWI
jgi:GNAT superfamily N-acetyltransferase